MLEENGLRAAFLPCGSIGVLIALPGHIVKVRHIWPQNLPVKPCILQVDLQYELVRKGLGFSWVCSILHHFIHANSVVFCVSEVKQALHH